MRNGEKFRSCGVPMERRTRAPAPSDCSTARKALRIALGTVIFAGLVPPYNARRGRNGRPLKDVVVVLSKLFVSAVN